MAFNRKKSRLIIVDNEPYRYVVSSGKNNDNGKFALNITVQIASGEGAILKVEGLVTRDFWLDFPNEVTSNENYPVITPNDISIIIKISLNNGWKPNEKGPSFIIRLDNSFIKKYAIK